DHAPRAIVPEAERTCLGVSLNDPDVRYVDAERVGGDLRHRGLVSGSGGSDSRQDGHRAGRAHPDRCRIVARDERRARYRAPPRPELLADADPETAALVPRLRLDPRKAIVADHLEHAAKRLWIIAAVEYGPRRLSVRELLRLDEVPQAHLGSVS